MKVVSFKKENEEEKGGGMASWGEEVHHTFEAIQLFKL